MSTNDFLNTSYDPTLAQPVADAAQQYPVIQWVSYAPGGWLLPVDRVEEFDVTPPAWAGNAAERPWAATRFPADFSPVAEVSILATTKRWFTTDENGKATYLTKYADGARSKTHALCIVKGSPDMFLLSAKGMTSADMAVAWASWPRPMKKVNATRPTDSFWIRIKAGDPQRLAKGATVTPAIVSCPARRLCATMAHGPFRWRSSSSPTSKANTPRLFVSSPSRVNNGNGDDPQPQWCASGCRACNVRRRHDNHVGCALGRLRLDAIGYGATGPSCRAWPSAGRTRRPSSGRWIKAPSMTRPGPRLTTPSCGTAPRPRTAAASLS